MQKDISIIIWDPPDTQISRSEQDSISSFRSIHIKGYYQDPQLSNYNFILYHCLKLHENMGDFFQIQYNTTQKKKKS